MLSFSLEYPVPNLHHDAHNALLSVKCFRVHAVAEAEPTTHFWQFLKWQFLRVVVIVNAGSVAIAISELKPPASQASMRHFIIEF